MSKFLPTESRSWPSALGLITALLAVAVLAVPIVVLLASNLFVEENPRANLGPFFLYVVVAMLVLAADAVGLLVLFGLAVTCLLSPRLADKMVGLIALISAVIMTLIASIVALKVA